MLPLIWVACGVAVAVSAARSQRHRGAVVAGRLATAVLYLGAGALVNTLMLVGGDDYNRFADGAYLSVVSDTWRTLVVPNHHLFISLLIAFELLVGVLVLRGGGSTQAAYALAISFHVALLSFGWGFALWSLPMIAAFIALLSAERSSPVPVYAGS